MKENVIRLFPRLMQLVWILSIAFVIYFSLMQNVEFPIQFNGIDKVYHALSYLWLAAIPFFGFERFKISLIGALSMFPLGIALEYAQIFVGGRFFSGGDMIANTMGIILGVALGGYLRSRFSVSF